MISIFVNTDKKIDSFTKRLSHFLQKKKIEHCIYNPFEFFKSESIKQLVQTKLTISLGGDGTILKIFSLLTKHKIMPPILPLHFGSLGFITSVHHDLALELLEHYLNQEKKFYKEDNRNFLEIIHDKNSYYALNEAFISRYNTDFGKPINIEATINQSFANNFNADGVLLSTATGSTAYNLSAGGPIIAPSVEAYVFNPVCPHSVSAKPIVMSSKDVIKIKTQTKIGKKPQTAALVVDGFFIKSIENPNFVKIRMANEKLTFIKPKKENYYDILNKKLKWFS